MTRQNNARIAGLAFLAYIAVGITGLVIGGDTDTLAAIAGNEFTVRLGAVLTFFCAFMAITLGVTLYALTREVDPDLAMFGLVCRVAEGVIGAYAVQRTLELLTLSKASGVNADVADGIRLFAVGGDRWTPVIAALLFAVGSTFFCWLFVRGRIVPSALAWLGVVSSILLVIVLPARILGLIEPPLSEYAWAPMAVFEIAVAFWLVFKVRNKELTAGL